MKHKTNTYSLREILQFAYQIQESMGPVNTEGLPQAMLLANEDDIVKNGGKVDIPDWRREQLEKSLKVRFPEATYYAVERAVLPILPDIENRTIRIERS